MKDSLLKGAYGDLSPEDAKQKSLQHTEKLKRGVLGGMDPEEIEAKRYETIEILHGKGGAPVASEKESQMQEAAFQAVLKGFQSDVDHIRGVVAEYNRTGDERLKELKLQSLKENTELIQSQITKQIEALPDAYKKGALANVEDELKAILKPLW